MVPSAFLSRRVLKQDHPTCVASNQATNQHVPLLFRVLYYMPPSLALIHLVHLYLGTGSCGGSQFIDFALGALQKKEPRKDLEEKIWHMHALRDAPNARFGELETGEEIRQGYRGRGEIVQGYKIH
eukprot:g24644.t1